MKLIPKILLFMYVLNLAKVKDKNINLDPYIDKITNYTHEVETQIDINYNKFKDNLYSNVELINNKTNELKNKTVDFATTYANQAVNYANRFKLKKEDAVTKTEPSTAATATPDTTSTAATATATNEAKPTTPESSKTDNTDNTAKAKATPETADASVEGAMPIMTPSGGAKVENQYETSPNDWKNYNTKPYYTACTARLIKDLINGTSYAVGHLSIWSGLTIRNIFETCAHTVVDGGHRLTGRDLNYEKWKFLKNHASDDGTGMNSPSSTTSTQSDSTNSPSSGDESNEAGGKDAATDSNDANDSDANDERFKNHKTGLKNIYLKTQTSNAKNIRIMPAHKKNKIEKPSLDNEKFKNLLNSLNEIEAKKQSKYLIHQLLDLSKTYDICKLMTMDGLKLNIMQYFCLTRDLEKINTIQSIFSCKMDDKFYDKSGKPLKCAMFI